MNYPNLQAFYAAEPQRERSPEVDFGCWWRSAHPGNRRVYRISWVEETGEVYMVDLSALRAPLTVLGTIPDRDTVEFALDRWEQHCGRYGGLDWAVARVRAHIEEEVTEWEPPTAA